MFLDKVLEHVEQRVIDTMWSFDEFDDLTIKQLTAVREIVSLALADTRIEFENATLEKNNE